MEPKKIYQKLRVRVKQQPRANPVEPTRALRGPFTCVVKCPRCGNEAAWKSACGYCPVKPDPAELKRAGFEWNPDDHDVWYFPRIVPPGTLEHSERGEPNVYRGHGYNNLGVVFCSACVMPRPMRLDWPRCAFYAISMKRTTIFAQDRLDFLALRSFLAAKQRRQLYRDGLAPWFVRYLPRGAIASKNREVILRAMDACLAR
ncbi:MAG: hypothetical protein K2W85_09850 [Phycisphaerales bacterium]|nr:hypothetical protein [Phycisphaerales bacterium]